MPPKLPDCAMDDAVFLSSDLMPAGAGTADGRRTGALCEVEKGCCLEFDSSLGPKIRCAANTAATATATPATQPRTEGRQERLAAASLQPIPAFCCPASPGTCGSTHSTASSRPTSSAASLGL